MKPNMVPQLLRVLDYLLVLVQLVKQFVQKMKEKGRPKQI